MINFEDLKTRSIVLIGSVLSIALVGLILFISSGNPRWNLAWAFLGVLLLCTLAGSAVISPVLMRERMGSPWRKPGLKKWDLLILYTIQMLWAAALFVAGLEMRFGWSDNVPLAIPAIASIVFLAGFSFSIWAMNSNPFFSTIVRLQGDSHTVAVSGPYCYVRHPGYVGMIIYMAAQPLMLGSYLALIPTVIIVLLFILRTGLEDRTLRGELPGYIEYAGRVTYRLLAWVW